LKETVEKTTRNVSGFQIVGRDQMKQRRAILVLRLKGLSKKAIPHEFVVLLQGNAISYSSVTRFCREARLGLNSEEVSSAIITQR
jgi:hypothetical protein